MIFMETEISFVHLYFIQNNKTMYEMFYEGPLLSMFVDTNIVLLNHYFI